MKQRRQVAVLAALVVIAIVIWMSYFRNDKPVTADNPPITQSIRLLSVDNPQIRWDELDKARKTEYKGTGRNPFSATPAASAPLTARAVAARTKPPFVPSGPKLSEAQLPPPPTCVLPPNMKFFGYGTVPNNSSRRAFFSNGEDIYVVTEGEILLNQYRIIKINNTTLEFEQVSSNCTRGTAPLIEQPASAAGPSQ